MKLGLHHKIALVTGGSHGIGKAIALALAREGCKVALCARRPQPIQQTLEQLSALDCDGLGIQSDLTREGEPARVMEQVLERYGGIHVLVNNVGGGGRWGKESIEQTAISTWMEVYNKNVLTAIELTRAAIGPMREQRWGRVVNITSIHGREGGGRPWFNMAKAAQTSMMKCLGMYPELARDGITFNSVAPGAIMIPDTGWEQQRQRSPEAFAQMLEREFTLGRLGTPEEVADVVTFLCSERASLVNGASVAVDGGDGRSF